MPRLFFALRTSDEQRGELGRAQEIIAQQLVRLGAHYRLENLQNSHCTLRFLGNVDAERVKPLIDNAEREMGAANVQPFELSLTTCGTFSNRGKARVIWAGLSEVPQLTALRTAIDKAVNASGIAQENDNAFHPHLTLIRLREPFLLPDTYTFPTIDPLPNNVTEIELVESKTLPIGAVHQVIARFGL
jgi:RNA 2',3'-cyclic 3'-phosphodiesterase